MRLWHALEADSRPVEFATGLLCCSMAVTALLNPMGWMPWPEAAAGWLVVSAAHMVAATTGMRKVRQGFAMLSVLVFGALAHTVVALDGWTRPGAPSFLASALIQVWVFLALEADQVDHRRREGSL